MNVVQTIIDKRDGSELADGEISDLVLAYTRCEVPDYQMSAWLMAVALRGMTVDETVALTRAMTASGRVLDLSRIRGAKIDKHSTGGVGDKVSLAVVPIVAAAGVNMAKMSGRGLGHTGGTLDKLESIPGFNVQLTEAQIIEQVERIGACICAQTADLAPADKKMYALRDVTGTVQSNPLIAASIMSKKLAGGSQAVALDIKVGRGAFMPDIESARSLGNLMMHIGTVLGIQVRCVLTSMEVPLGRAVGNRIEVEEAAALLRGLPSDPRLRDEVVLIAGVCLELAGVGSTPEACRLLNSGAAWTKFLEIVAAQGADPKFFESGPDKVPSYTVVAPKSGFVCDIDALKIGGAAMALGAGRHRIEDKVDPLAGIWLNALVGSHIERGEPIATISASSVPALKAVPEKTILEAFSYSDFFVPPAPTLIETLAMVA